MPPDADGGQTPSDAPHPPAPPSWQPPREAPVPPAPISDPPAPLPWQPPGGDTPGPGDPSAAAPPPPLSAGEPVASARPPEGFRRTAVLTVVAGVSATLLGIGYALTNVWLSSATQPGADGGTPWLLLVIVASIIYQGIREAVGWWFRHYDVGDTELTIDEGVVARHRKVVPYARLQQVDIVQGPFAQMLGLAVLQFSTAGNAGASTVGLRYLTRSDAETLRTWMLQRRNDLSTHAHSADDASDATAQWAGPARTLLSIPPGRLVVAASTTFGVIIAIVVAALVVAALLVSALGATPTGLGRALAGSLVLWVMVGFALAMSMASTVIALYGWRLDVRGDDLHVNHGWLTRQQITLPRRRVQQIVIADNPLRRALGLVSVRLDSAAGGGGPTSLSVPVLARGDVDRFVREAMGSNEWAVEGFEPRPAPARRRAIVRRIAVLCTVAVVGVSVLVRPTALGVLAVVAVAAPVGVLWGVVAHRRAGWALTPTILALAAGVVTHRTELVPLERVQSARTTQSPLQRLARLRTFSVDVAGAARAPSLHDADGARAASLCTSLPRAAVRAEAPR